MVKALYKSSSLEPKGQWPWGLVCSIRDLGQTKRIQMMTLVVLDLVLRVGQICFLMLLYRKIYISSGKMLESHLMEETYNKRPEWQKVHVDIKLLTPRGCLPLPEAIYSRIKAWKNVYKIRLKEILLKLATNGQSDKAFLLTSKFCPKWVVCPGAIYMYKSMKNMYKNRTSRQVFKYLDPILIYISLWIDCLFEIRKIAVYFLWLSLPGHYRVTDEALLGETT